MDGTLSYQTTCLTSHETVAMDCATRLVWGEGSAPCGVGPIRSPRCSGEQPPESSTVTSDESIAIKRDAAHPAPQCRTPSVAAGKPYRRAYPG
jgi:hypothetical protein